MTYDEIKKLLAIAAAFDGRKPSEATARAWLDAATRNRWTYDEAAEAIKTHYGTNTEWIMPGHVTNWIKDQRQDRALRGTAAELTTAPPPARPARALTALADATRIPDDPHAVTRAAAMRVKCPHCGSPPGEQCTRPGLGGRRRRTKPHPTRTESTQDTA